MLRRNSFLSELIVNRILIISMLSIKYVYFKIIILLLLLLLLLSLLLNLDGHGAHTALVNYSSVPAKNSTSICLAFKFLRG